MIDEKFGSEFLIRIYEKSFQWQESLFFVVNFTIN